MDSYEEARDYDAMDHSEVNRVFVADFLAAAGDLFAPTDDGGEEEPRTPLVLDLGTGTAQIPIELCRQTENLRVLGIDLAVHMLDLARLNVEVAGLRDRISLQRVDAKGLPYGARQFSAVMSNSILHHVPEPKEVLREALQALVPKGLLFVRDLMRPETDAHISRLVELYAGDANEHQRKMLDDSLRAALSLDEIRQLVTELGLHPDAVQPTSDRHWTLSAIV
jgi:ubiquinone/menaquinone biosynthesis C-methylase UbiE